MDTAAVPVDGPASKQARGDTPRRIRGDLRFLRMYVYTIPRTLGYRAPAGEDLNVSPAESVERIEGGLAIEARRYRLCALSVGALLLSMPILIAVLWSGMWWLPVQIYWWPFERGNYGLPFLSLFEWMAYLLLAAYAAITLGILQGGLMRTRCLGAEYRRLRDADPEWRDEIVRRVSAGDAPRTAFLLRKASVFSAYREAIDAIGNA